MHASSSFHILTLQRAELVIFALLLSVFLLIRSSLTRLRQVWTCVSVSSLQFVEVSRSNPPTVSSEEYSFYLIADWKYCCADSCLLSRSYSKAQVNFSVLRIVMSSPFSSDFV